MVDMVAGDWSGTPVPDNPVPGSPVPDSPVPDSPVTTEAAELARRAPRKRQPNRRRPAGLPRGVRPVQPLPPLQPRPPVQPRRPVRQLRPIPKLELVPGPEPLDDAGYAGVAPPLDLPRAPGPARAPAPARAAGRRPAPSPVRRARPSAAVSRQRRVFFWRRMVVVAGIASLGAGVWVAGEWVMAVAATRPTAPVSQHFYVARPGDTIWGIAVRYSAGGDPRPLAARLESQIGGGVLQPGDRLAVP